MKFKLCALPVLFFIYITSIHAQDYLISFNGTGAATTVTTVKIENLTQGTNITISGSDILHLVNIISGDETIDQNSDKQIYLYPNPMTDYARMQFVLPESGETFITLYDMSGRKLAQKRDILSKGKHTYEIQNTEQGIYFVRISSGKYSLSGRLICSGSQKNSTKIIYENSIAAIGSTIESKSTNTESVMQYNDGDRLKFTGINGIYRTVIVDVPTNNKNITFNFIPCTDEDENNYPVVILGNQIWMGENLKTTKYCNGDPIPNVTDGPEWAGLTTPAYCWYDNDSGYKNVYGALYNWYTVKTGNICPDGWHVSTDDEWHQLIFFLDTDAVVTWIESKIAASALKETGTAHWNPPSTGTDESGFTALPGGYRKYTGSFGGATDNANWRTASEYDSTNVWYRYMFTNSGDVYRQTTNMQAGYSVRCLKDQ
ncbi:MAG: T9SS type A sorting domain-containing protein [Bacteroidales bacterium]|nr:T9SS type A sorting domain-containing protein [Bacteroidales bacterium]